MLVARIAFTFDGINLLGSTATSLYFRLLEGLFDLHHFRLGIQLSDRSLGEQGLNLRVALYDVPGAMEMSDHPVTAISDYLVWHGFP